MKKLELTILVLLLLLPASVSAQGISGGELLKFLPGARANGMGDMYVSVGGDLYGMHYNPASLFSAGKSAGLMYVNGIEDTDYGFLGYAQPLKNGGVAGASIIYFDGGMIDIVGGPLAGARVAQSDFLFTVCYSRDINGKGLFLGGNVKVLRSTLVQEYTALALAGDLGAVYRKGGFSAGIAFQNIGTGLKYVNVADPLQACLRAGASYSFSYRDYVLLAGADIVYPPGIALKLNTGLELLFRDTYALRLGYKFGYDLESFSAGAGYRTGKYGFNYTFAPFGGIGSLAQRLSIAMYFDAPGAGPPGQSLKEKARKYYKAGLADYREGKYAKAVKKWKRVLKILPGHKKTRAMIDKAKTKLGQERGE